MTPQELKNSILQLAIQGKLVEQRPEEGTAAELYKQIQAEKQELIKAGKIKKEKPLPEITEDEIPFEIPESWMWVRWGEVINIVSARRVHQLDWKTEGIPFYRAREIAKLAENGYVDNELFISQELFDEFSKSGVPQPGDLMVTAVGTLGKTYIVKQGDRFYYKDASVICFENYGHILPDYLKYVMQSEMMNRQIRSNSSGTTVATLTMVRMIEYYLPLPPLAEQKRIVAKIEELLPLIERYEKAWSRLEDFNKRFPGDMQKSILQMSIQGKLVEQRPEEGTGEELYKQIQAEKQALVKAGKIKKEKPLLEITEDEIPFEIPESWKWVRLPDVSSMCLGKMLDKQKNKGTSCLYLRNVNVRWGGFDLSDLLEMKFEDEWDERFLIQPGDLVMCEGGEPGRCAVWKETYSIHFQKALHRIRFYEGILPQLYQLLFYHYANSGMLVSLFTGTTIKHLTGQALDKVIIPLPPLDEQKRIVARLEELLPLCERLK